MITNKVRRTVQHTSRITVDVKMLADSAFHKKGAKVTCHPKLADNLVEQGVAMLLK